MGPGLSRRRSDLRRESLVPRLVKVVALHPPGEAVVPIDRTDHVGAEVLLVPPRRPIQGFERFNQDDQLELLR